MASTRITWHDILQAPEDGKRYEAIDGGCTSRPPRQFGISGSA